MLKILFKFSNPPGKYRVTAVIYCYSNFTISDNFLNYFLNGNYFLISKVMKYIAISKAMALDKFSGRFLRDVLEVLAKPISEFFNMSLYQRIFLNTCQVVKQL